MTDPGGGYGWRSGGHLPRRRGGVFGWGRIAEDIEDLFREERPLCVLLLPAPLEEFELRERAEDLLTAPGVAAVDPPRLSYGGAARLGEAFADAHHRPCRRAGCACRGSRARWSSSTRSSTRSRARCADVHPDAELWYGPAGEPEGERVRTLHALARERAAHGFERSDAPRAHAEPAAVGADGGAGDRERPARLRAHGRALGRRADLRLDAAQQVGDVARDLGDLALVEP